MTRITTLATSPAPWGVPLFCLGEFVRVVTHRKILTPPSSTQQAIDFIDALTTSESFCILLPDAAYWAELRSILVGGRVSGNLAFDAQIAAICLHHGAVLLTHDRDFATLGIQTTTL